VVEVDFLSELDQVRILSRLRRVPCLHLAHSFWRTQSPDIVISEQLPLRIIYSGTHLLFVVVGVYLCDCQTSFREGLIFGGLLKHRALNY